jgi:hypothetical protein
MDSRVADKATGEVTQLPATMPVGAALAVLPADAWAVITAEDGVAVGLASAEDLRTQSASVSLGVVARALSPLVVVAPGVAVVDAVRSRAFRALRPRQPVLVEDREGVHGVWAGAGLAEAIVAYGSTRSPDAELHGRIGIAQIRRQCGYMLGTRPCPAARSFPEPPDELPECDNPGRLAAHRFVW